MISESSKRFKLDDKNLETLKNLIDDLFSEMRSTRKRSMYHFKDIPITSIDGIEYQLPIWIDPKMETYAAIGYDKSYPISVDNVALIINPRFIESKKQLYNSLYHEFLHAVDPTITTNPSKKYQSKYGDPSERPDLYYSHGIELRGITGEFFEALVNEFSERALFVKDYHDKKILHESLKSIVDYFNQSKPLTPMAMDILDKMNGLKNLNNDFKQSLSDVFKTYPKLIEFVKETSEYEPYYLACIRLIKQYSPKGWKKFLTMLHTTSEEIKEIINKNLEETHFYMIKKIIN